MSDDKMAPQECPCGYFNDHRRACICTPTQISRYLAKISGPLLDRIDLQVEVAALTTVEEAGNATGRQISLTVGKRFG
jgi:magnesium chelatase family protein